MSEDGIIGKGDGMPWHIEEEYQQYLNFVEGQTVIMGRRSYEIFGNDLTSKNNLVISRSGASSGDFEVFNDFGMALDRADEFGKKIFIAGGASIYRLGLEVALSMYLSVIRGSYRGDICFPQIDRDQWTLHRRLLLPRYQFSEYRRDSN